MAIPFLDNDSGQVAHTHLLLSPINIQHLDPMLRTLCHLSSIIHLCLWTVSNVHSRLLCSVRRLGFLVITGACVTIFVNCEFFNYQFIIMIIII